MVRVVENTPAKGVSYFIPAVDPPAGTATPREDGTLPKIFQPLKIRGVTLPNRIWVSPMCQYSGKDGFVGPWHTVHYGTLTSHGPGFTMVEASAVADIGRLTPEDVGIYLDAHVKGLSEIVDFAHSQSSVIGIQIGHGGRKASGLAPWLGPGVATREVGGWPEKIVGPDDQPFSLAPEDSVVPHALTLEGIAEVRAQFVAAAQRAVRAGFDIVELHFAHGYLLSNFFSPATNGRTDRYGGSFENRVRLALEIVEDVRAVLPESMPLFVRISASDWLANNPDYAGRETWTVEQSAQLALLLAERGVDVLDVSSGGIHRDQKIQAGPGYQAGMAKHIKKVVGDKMLVSVVGAITSGAQAEKLIVGSTAAAADADDKDTPLDLVAVGRGFQKNPFLVWQWAEELGITIQLPGQIRWGFAGRKPQAKAAEKTASL